jgi:hypothetical protein
MYIAVGQCCTTAIMAAASKVASMEPLHSANNLLCCGISTVEAEEQIKLDGRFKSLVVSNVMLFRLVIIYRRFKGLFYLRNVANTLLGLLNPERGG